MSQRDIAEPRPALFHTPRDFMHGARPGLLAGSIMLACATWWLSSGGVYTWQVLFAWLSSLLFWLLVWWPNRRNGETERRRDGETRRGGEGETGSRRQAGGLGVSTTIVSDPTEFPENPKLVYGRRLRHTLGVPYDSTNASALRNPKLPFPVSPSLRLSVSPSPWLTILLLALILVVGGFFRFYQLSEVPREPTSDHAEKLLDVLDVLDGQRPIFFRRNTGREPVQFYFSFVLMRGLGFPFSWETLKWGTALIGLAAVPAVYMVGRELRGNVAGLVAALLFAIGKWPTSLSRAGLRYPLVLLPAALVVWSLLRYLRKPDRRLALLCGLVIGAGLHGYISFRIVPLLVPLFLGLGLLMDRRLRSIWRGVVADGALIAATALLACLPLARYSVQHPDQVWYRVATRAANAERSLGDTAERLRIFAGNNLRALQAFNIRGDATRVIAVSYDPLLDPLTGAAFVGGVVLAAYAALRRRAPRYAALLLALPVLLLPSTLSIAFPHENPSANRLGVAGVVVFPLAALPLAWIIHVAQRRRMLRLACGVALAGLLLLATRHNYLRYFRDYNAQYRKYVPNTSQVAGAIRARLGEGIALDDVYLLAFPHWLDGRNIAFALGDIDWKAQHDIPSDAPLPERKTDAALLYVLSAGDPIRLEQLRYAYPDGYEELITPPAGEPFILYTVPPAAATGAGASGPKELP